MRIALVTDAWEPQVNGVVRTLNAITAQLRQRGHDVSVISPDQFRTIPCPTYPEIRLAIDAFDRMALRLDSLRPDAIHIATEGPLGWAARGWCVRRGRAFTTAYHTQFPDYLARRTRLPAALFWPYIRRFHGPSAGIMVATESIRDHLRRNGLNRLRAWSRGVDLSAFGPDRAPPDLFCSLPRPIQLYVGRVAPEKNIEAFLASSHHGSKVVVGDGPALPALRRAFPDVCFLGHQEGDALAACYAGADVMVFPSRTDTFGLVMIEALASGTPVAAYPVPGPRDILTDGCGAMDADLDTAIAAALTRDRDACLERGRSFTWDASADQFLRALETDTALARRVPPPRLAAA